MPQVAREQPKRCSPRTVRSAPPSRRPSYDTGPQLESSRLERRTLLNTPSEHQTSLPQRRRPATRRQSRKVLPTRATCADQGRTPARVQLPQCSQQTSQQDSTCSPPLVLHFACRHIGEAPFRSRRDQRQGTPARRPSPHPTADRELSTLLPRPASQPPRPQQKLVGSRCEVGRKTGPSDPVLRTAPENAHRLVVGGTRASALPRD